MYRSFVSFCILGYGISAFADPIEDNSFLVEEAYNQEAGVVQFINGFQYMKESKSFAYSFTNEIPMGSQLHQISYTIPYVGYESSEADIKTSERGIGDVLVNYRYQLVNSESVSMAPRISILVPTGDYKKGLGTGALGVQFNQTVSIKVSPSFVNHYNLGFTFTPGSKEPGGKKADTTAFNYSTSLVYLLTDSFNFLCEFVGASSEAVTPEGGRIRQDSFLIVPGARYAFDFESGLQIVPGAAYIQGLASSEKETGFFAYLSFENKLW